MGGTALVSMSMSMLMSILREDREKFAVSVEQKRSSLSSGRVGAVVMIVADVRGLLIV